MGDREYRLRLRIDELRSERDRYLKEALRGRWARGHAKKFRKQRDEAQKEVRRLERALTSSQKAHQRDLDRLLRLPA
jgi:hypothetical protein